MVGRYDSPGRAVWEYPDPMDVMGVLLFAAMLVLTLVFAAVQLYPAKGGEWIVQQFARIGLAALSTGCFTALSLELDDLAEKLFYAAVVAGVIDAAAFVVQRAREHNAALLKPTFLVLYYLGYLGSMGWWTTHMSSNPGADWIKVMPVMLVTANFSLILIAPGYAAKERPAR